MTVLLGVIPSKTGQTRRVYAARHDGLELVEEGPAHRFRRRLDLGQAFPDPLHHALVIADHSFQLGDIALDLHDHTRHRRLGRAPVGDILAPFIDDETQHDCKDDQRAFDERAAQPGGRGGGGSGHQTTRTALPPE